MEQLDGIDVVRVDFDGYLLLVVGSCSMFVVPSICVSSDNGNRSALNPI